MAEPVIDPATFAELQDTAGAEFVGDLVATFLEEAPQMLAELRAAQSAASADRFRRAAHSLKSNANTFGALRLGEMARRLELGGLAVDTGPIDALQAEYDRVAAALQELTGG
jgi:HPt (histidine-containing phosphotransfer) domain-containing protein